MNHGWTCQACQVGCIVGQGHHTFGTCYTNIRSFAEISSRGFISKETSLLYHIFLDETLNIIHGWLLSSFWKRNVFVVPYILGWNVEHHPWMMSSILIDELGGYDLDWVLHVVHYQWLVVGACHIKSWGDEVVICAYHKL